MESFRYRIARALLIALLWMTPTIAVLAQSSRQARPDVIPAEWLEFGLGLQPSIGDLPQLDRSELGIELSAPPPAVDLSADLPPVGNQGSLGSCVGWTLGYYYKTWQEQVERGWGADVTAHQFSASWIYNQRNTLDCNANEGMSLWNGMNIIKAKGAATLATFPHQVGDPCTQPPQAAHDEAWQYRIESFANVFAGSGKANLNELKTLLASGYPLAVAVPVYHPSFYLPNSNDPLVRRPRGNEKMFGGHAVLVVGYDDQIGGFKFVNSWGPSYGDKGFAYLSYEFMRKDVWEAWIMIDQVAPHIDASLELHTGWNLVSLPTMPTSNDPSMLFDPMADHVDEIYVWDADDGYWRRYIPSAPPYTNSLSSINPSQGLWIKANADVTLTLNGTPRQNGSVDLDVGWNLVAFPGAEAISTTRALANIAAQVSMVHGYDAAQSAWLTYRPLQLASSTLKTMAPGEAYWIEVAAPCTWRIE
jgi:C1A family cysteine protease